MSLRSSLVLASALLASLIAADADAASRIRRSFELSPDRITLTPSGDVTIVSARGGMPESRPGRPEVPWITELVDLPEGQRIASVRVVAAEFAPLSARVQLPSARVPKPGLGPIERTPRDTRYFSSGQSQPETIVELGAQGGWRGRDVAALGLAAARWNPSSGALERLARVEVELVLEPTGERSLVRERVVPEWEDAPLAGRTATAFGAARVAKPSTPAAPFKATQLPSLLGSPVEYVIITDEAQAPIYQQLADWKTQKGVPAVVRTLSFIQQQYPLGSDDAERVRLFLRDAYTRWGTKYVLLGGDTGVLPTRFAYTRFYDGNYIATDLYYSCLDGNWNADGDSIYGEGYTTAQDTGDNCDLYPEVYVGRAPTLNAAQAQQFVNRSMQYEKNPAGDYENKVLFFAEVLFPQDWQPGDGVSLDGAELVEDVLPVLATNPSLLVRRLYQNYTDPLWTPGSFPESRQAVIDTLNKGWNVAVHVGHGYRNVMSVGDASLTNQDALALANGNRLTNLYAINCTSNAINFPSIGEAFMQATSGGAVTNIGSTNLDFPTAGRAYQTEYFTLLYQDSITTIGEAQALQKVPYIGFSTTDGVNRWTQMTLLLLGDPELQVYTGKPRTMTVAHASTMAATDTTLAVNVLIGGQPLYGARVTAYIGGVDFGTTLTDGAGNALVHVRPDSIGTLTLTVTGFDCRPYQATLSITAPVAPVLSLETSTIDDDALGGTLGNADGAVDAGETVDVTLAVANHGGTAANNVVASLSTTDPSISIGIGTASYGSIGAGGTALPAAGFRITVPTSVEDQREVPFDVVVSDDAGHLVRRSIQLTVRAAELRQYTHVVLDPSGNNNGIPDPGETVTLRVRVRNDGTGRSRGIYARLRPVAAFDPNVDVFDSTAAVVDLASGQDAVAEDLSLRFNTTSGVALLYLYDEYGLRTVQRIDPTYPTVPTALAARGEATNIQLQWQHSPEADLRGYYIYRSSTSGGTYTRVNGRPTERTSYYLDEGLSPLTYYYYKITAVDSSGNESALSGFVQANTNPPLHAIFPIAMDRLTPAPVAVDHLYPGYPMDIVAGSGRLFVWHLDGSSPIDADGGGSTSGDFTLRGEYYAAGGSIGDLDGDHVADIAAGAWDSLRVYTFDLAGNVRPGWPVLVPDGMWSAPALGDLDNDGKMEIVIGSNGNKIYALRENGTEVIDGDSNPSTLGVFKLLSGSFNFGTAAIADLDNNGQKDIVYGGADGWLYAWRPNGTNLPGFPRFLGGSITGSVAVGYLDGAGDTQMDIAVVSSIDSLWVVRADGSIRTRLWMRIAGTSKQPSPAIADVNMDGFADVVVASTNGGLYVVNRNSVYQAPWLNIRYSPLTGGASESSPIVADLNGDGINDILMGDETGQLTAFSGNNASILPGFPIQVGAEIRGVPAACDCDADGKTEIVLASWDKNLYVWDYDFPFNPVGAPAWPQFHHDARRTGFTGSLAFVDVEGPTEGPAPARLSLAAPSPNPTRSLALVRFGIPTEDAGARYELAAFDLAGRRLATLASGPARAGEYTARWNLTTDAGARVSDGVYFLRLAVGAKSEARKVIVVR